MAELSIQDRLKQAQAKVKTLGANREQIIGDIRVEEQKLSQAYASLKELGIEAETKTSKELRAMEEEYKAQLSTNLEAIETQLASGEELMQKYNELKTA